MKTILSDLVNLFFPRLCVHCSKRLVNSEQHICLDCLDNLPRTGYYKEQDNKLEEFFAGRFPFERIASFGFYHKEGILQSAIHSLKYQNNPDIGVFLGSLCGQDMLHSDFLKDINYIIPIPLHPTREKKRGYNQSLKIAEGIASQTNIPVNNSALMRIVNNASQTQQSKFERWSNTKDIFFLKEPQELENKHILLLDDVITTGSTIEACAKTILNSCENVKISVYSVAVGV